MRRRPGKQTKKAGSFAPRPATPSPSSPHAGDTETAYGAADPIGLSNLSLHELFEQQARDMLERADLEEEQKQSILVAMACPCCGIGGMSFSVKLKRRHSPDGA